MDVLPLLHSVVSRCGLRSNSNSYDSVGGTLGIVDTFRKNPHYGALSLITQYSYLTRAPWFVASGAPKNGHLSMGYVDLRYTLP